MVVDPTSRTVLSNDAASSGATVSSVTIAGSTATLGVSISGISTTTPMPISAEAPIPVSLNGGGSVEVTATAPLPVTVNGGGTLDANITNVTPIPVSFETAGGMDVTVTNASPISVDLGSATVNTNITNVTPVPVSFETAGGMDVNVTNASPIDVSISGGSINAVITNVTSTNPLPVEFSTAGGMDVSLVSLISGEDQTNNWLKTADGATQGYHLNPYGSGSAGDVGNYTVLGASGAAGDYLKSLIFSVRSATTAAAFILQDGQVLGTTGSSGTAPSGTTTLSVTATSAVTVPQNYWSGRIISFSYQPTGAATTHKIYRRITAHAAFSSATALSFTVTHAVPAGGVISSWQVEGVNSYEILPYNTPVGVYKFDLGEVSTSGAWRIAIDSGVSCHAVGKFT